MSYDFFVRSFRRTDGTGPVTIPLLTRPEGGLNGPPAVAGGALYTNPGGQLASVADTGAF